MPTVIKKDGRRELFDRQKIIVGLLKACEKRPISRETIEGIVTEIEREIQSLMRSEIPSSLIGEKVMARLHDLDDVAYVRFASVYRQFKGLDEFMEELKKLHPKRAKEKE
jgi:transcriptional repressor NrdR